MYFVAKTLFCWSEASFFLLCPFEIIFWNSFSSWFEKISKLYCFGDLGLSWNYKSYSLEVEKPPIILAKIHWSYSKFVSYLLHICLNNGADLSALPMNFFELQLQYLNCGALLEIAAALLSLRLNCGWIANED
jgi:hypothetical protein